MEAWQLATVFKRNLLLEPWVIPNELMEKEKRKRHEQCAERALKKARLPRKAGEHVSEKPGHREFSTETTLLKVEKPKIFYGKRREKKPNNSENISVKSRGERDIETPTVALRIKSEPVLDTVADRLRIQQILQQREDLELAAVKEGKKLVYPTIDRKKIKPEEDSKNVFKVQYFSAASKTRPPQFENNSSSTHSYAKSKREVYRTSELTSSLSSTKSNACPISSKFQSIGHVDSESTVLSPVLPRSLPTPPETFTHRSLKLLILTYIHTTPIPNFTISSLRLTPEIEAYATKVAQVQNPQAAPTPVVTSGLIFKTYCDVLQTLVHDGNLIRVRPYSSYAYIAVGKWNLGDLIEEAVITAKAQALRKLERKEQERVNIGASVVVEVWKKPMYGANIPPVGRVAVRSIWLKTQARGGGWEGVTKGVVAEVVKEVLEEQGGWKDVGRGLWEWKADTG